MQNIQDGEFRWRVNCERQAIVTVVSTQVAIPYLTSQIIISNTCYCSTMMKVGTKTRRKSLQRNVNINSPSNRIFISVPINSKRFLLRILIRILLHVPHDLLENFYLFILSIPVTRMKPFFVVTGGQLSEYLKRNRS